MTKPELYIGIMSGTSLDGIDAVICSFDGGKIEVAGSASLEWPEQLRAILLHMASSRTVDMEQLSRSHFLLSHYYADAVRLALSNSAVSAEMIRAIGLHGQTIRHLPLPASIAPGSPARGATFQLGSGPALAALTGIDVVNDFRSADVALGGHGAPLVPMFDLVFLRSDEHNRLITNIGGISNVTWIPRSANAQEVIAFDTGPGNMIMDALAQKYLGAPFDANGDAAAKGNSDNELVTQLLYHEYFKTPPPKSTGRELFGNEFFKLIDDKITTGELTHFDALATALDLTARSIAQALTFLPSRDAEIIVSGGGARNTALLQRIRTVSGRSVSTSETIGIDPQLKEAVAFAYFAKAFIDGTVIHLPRTTGASHATILGSLARGNTRF